MRNIRTPKQITTTDLRNPKLLSRFVRALVRKPFPNYGDIKTGAISPDSAAVQLRNTRKQIRSFVESLFSHGLTIEEIRTEVEGVVHPHGGNLEKEG
ncbi:hypothetical protein HYW42_00275 [Candidatus Daviesbacteria bacterium]|nr:hypothetical protein [Candidatus Daviesbacteria bacterium]